MQYQDILYKLDHYDTWNYIIIGPLSLLATICFIIITLMFKQSRQFPGNLLIMISFAEMVLCIHWIWSGFKSPYITGQPIREDSYFCQANSQIAVLAASLELTFQFSFLLSIIFRFKNTMKEIKFKFIFFILPLAFSITTWLIAMNNNTMGLNVFGTCSLKKVKNSGVFFWIINSSYLLLVIITIYVLKNYQKMSESQISIKQDFFNFYFEYAILTFLMYSLIGFNFFIDKYIDQAFQDNTDEKMNVIYAKFFYLTRLGNNIKIFIPLLTLLLRLNDPFFRKLVSKFINKHIYKIKSSDIDLDEDQNQKDFLINNQIRQLRQGIAKSILKGIFDYYHNFQDKIQQAKDEELSNLLTYQIKEDSDRKSIRKTEILDKKFFKCQMSSLFSFQFDKIMKSSGIKKFSESFNVAKNQKAIANSGQSDGGKGGEFFLMTHDKKFFIKTINSEEQQVFDNIIKEYSTYFQNNKESFIAKIFGFFIFEFEVTQQKLKVIVIENVFKRNPSLVHRKYDMKGSTYSRKVLKSQPDIEENSQIKKVLKDIDFINIEQKMNFKPEIGLKVYNQLKSDVQFFQQHKIIDYSILLGVIDLKDITNEQDKETIELLEQESLLFKDNINNKAYMMGIIDYFQLYTFNKCLEKYTKKIMNLNSSLDTSSQPANFYARRFLLFLEQVIKYQLIYQTQKQIMLFIIFAILINSIISFPLSLELQQDQPHCFVQQFEPNIKVNVHYTLQRQQNLPNQQVVIQFFSTKTLQPISQPFLLNYDKHRFLYTHQSHDRDCKMCIKVNVGKVEISTYFKIDKFKGTIPTKTDVGFVSKKISQDIETIKQMKDKMDTMKHYEQELFLKNYALDKKLINLTIIETLIIIIAFILEYAVLSHYLKKRNLY